MKYSYSIKEIRAADERAIKSGTSSSELMERAGKALADETLRAMKEQNISDALFVCGGGNNGGDGFVAARILQTQGTDVAVLCLAGKFSHDCAEAAKKYGGVLFGRIPRRRYALIVDCIFGTGLSSAPKEDAAALIEFINGSGAYVLSCDLPSGLAENGTAYLPCVCADRTVTVGGLKNALLLADGADVAGEICLADIGLSPQGGAQIWERGDVKTFFPARKSHTHKGSYGSAGMLALSAKYSGAAFLAASACLKSGVGYTKLFADEPLYTQAVGKLPAAVLAHCATVDDEALACDALAYGMGAGVSEATYQTTCELLARYEGTLILDADALNSLARFGCDVLRKAKCRVILTPHIGEFARLSESGEVVASAMELARDFAKEYGVLVVLKNNRTIIADGERAAINLTGSPALAKGGSGDVLSGLLAGTCARGVPPYEAACVACFLLGRAGELAERELGTYSVTASDVIDRLPKSILSL